MKRYEIYAALALVAVTPAPSHAAAGHVHGAAALQISVDGERLTLDFASPLDNLLGFERAPRTDKEKEAVRRMRERLQKPELLFVPTPEARCARDSVKIASPALDGGKPDRDGHAALSAEIVFRCERPQQLSSLEVKLFEAFAGVKSLDVQVAGAKKQTGARVTARNPRVSW